MAKAETKTRKETDMERQEIGGATLRPEVAAKVAEHYEHARRKHPHFAHTLFLEASDESAAARTLVRTRFCLNCERREGEVVAETVLNCEICEAIHALACGDKANAVEEIYDAIAVLLRMVDVIEGRQALGNPESAKEAK